MTYEENVRKVAEEMVMANYPGIEPDTEAYNYALQRERRNAVIAVRLQSEAVRNALLKHSDIKSKEETAYLIEKGLIPENDQS